MHFLDTIHHTSKSPLKPYSLDVMARYVAPGQEIPALRELILSESELLHDTFPQRPCMPKEGNGQASAFS